MLADGVMNEHQVAFGEGTCGCLFGAKPVKGPAICHCLLWMALCLTGCLWSQVNKGGKALLSIDTMSQIGLERAKTAKEAVNSQAICCGL